MLGPGPIRMRHATCIMQHHACCHMPHAACRMHASALGPANTEYRLSRFESTNDERIWQATERPRKQF